MMRQINKLVKKLENLGYISKEKAPWLQYALEKRLSSSLAYVVMITIGLAIVDPITLLAYFFSFNLLRNRTSGFHAKTIGKCILFSIFAEVFFLKIIPLLWNRLIANISFCVSFFVIWLFAPYNHPNINLTTSEINACAKSAKLRLVALTISVTTSRLVGLENFATGIMLGTIMAAVTMSVAYASEMLVLIKKI